MAFVGYAIIVVVATAILLAGADVLLSVRLVGAAAILLGSIVLGVISIRARVFPFSKPTQFPGAANSLCAAFVESIWEPVTQMPFG